MCLTVYEATIQTIHLLLILVVGPALFPQAWKAGSVPRRNSTSPWSSRAGKTQLRAMRKNLPLKRGNFQVLEQ